MSQSQQGSSVRRFNELIPYRVHEVLLVSSPYDAFILQEDGHLTETMFFQYREVSLSTAPRFTHVVNGEEAIQLLGERRFDLILAMTSLADMDVAAFSRRVKSIKPNLPIVLLALDRREAGLVREPGEPEALDGFFLWTGDLSILLAIIKSVEDRRNVDHDIARGNVRVILMVEDSPKYYSSFLGLLYRELMRQSLSLYSEGLSEIYRKMYMMSRPKVLHARSFEEGVRLFERYRENVLAVICDVRIPRGSKPDPEAGLDFARYARLHDPALPLLIQSAEVRYREDARVLGAAFVDKNSPSLLAEIEEFLSFRLGFGDFIFRTPDGQEYDRARDLRELEEKLATVPDEVLRYHASNNHVSIWLMARSEFQLAEELRPKKVTDFPTITACRRHLVNVLQENRRRFHRGIVSDFSPEHFETDLFSRIGTGYLGGKARGIAFLNQTLADLDDRDLDGLSVSIPQSTVVATDEFDQFLVNNDLRDFAYSCESDREIRARFLRSRLTESLIQRLEFMVNRLEGPLAVRSSSLLEDSMHQPFAGIYSTLMIPNLDPDPTVRLKELCSAIKLVFASTFSENAKSYLAATGNRIEEEKMAVILQRVVGQPYGRRYYPHFSGLAQSRNYYPVGPQRPEEGIAHLALGLGRQIVDGGRALRFCPRHPGVMPQFANPKLLLDHSQRGFWALELDTALSESDSGLYSTLGFFELDAAERDGTLSLCGSVYDSRDQVIRDDLLVAGPRLITFNNVLKHRAVPLPQILTRIMEIMERALAGPVEVEFAGDMGDWGRPRRIRIPRRDPMLYLLQLRPLVSRWEGLDPSRATIDREELLCASRSSLGHGLVKDIRDLVYVRKDRWEAAHNRVIAREVGEVNARLKSETRPYLLIGPGRWGTADEWLGIPVQWSQISDAKVIVEASPEGYDVDPSQGTHFFHNITAQGIGYVTVPPGGPVSDSFLDWDWLTAQAALVETEHLRLLRFEDPLPILLEGREGRAYIGKPGSMRAGPS